MFRKVIIHLCFFTVFLVLSHAMSADAAERKYPRSIESYSVPDVILVNQEGKKVSLKNFVETEQPVVLDFIYATCTTICPVLSASYVNLQKKLGLDAPKARLVSITIDPEHDTPKIMKEYLKRYNARPGWDFLTGTRGDIDRVMNAFNAYIPDKMSHYQLTLIRMPKNGKWIRIKSLISSAELLEEYLLAGRK